MRKECLRLVVDRTSTRYGARKSAGDLVTIIVRSAMDDRMVEEHSIVTTDNEGS